MEETSLEVRHGFGNLVATDFEEFANSTGPRAKAALFEVWFYSVWFAVEKLQALRGKGGRARECRT